MPENYLTARVLNNDPLPPTVAGIELPPEMFNRAWLCMEALEGIESPAAFVSKVRELIEEFNENPDNTVRVYNRIEDLAALLPAE